MPSERQGSEDRDLRAARKNGNPLQRGSACLCCRKRKMKCDATKPVCRQCIKGNRADECDYDDGRQKSRTQILQEKIAKLEDRIRELEGAEELDALTGSFDIPSGSGAVEPFGMNDYRSSSSTQSVSGSTSDVFGSSSLSFDSPAASYSSSVSSADINFASLNQDLNVYNIGSSSNTVSHSDPSSSSWMGPFNNGSLSESIFAKSNFNTPFDSSLAQALGVQIPQGSSSALGNIYSSGQITTTSHSYGKANKWDSDDLPLSQRKLLADIFLPHASQCGLDLTPDRLYQRLEIDTSYLGQPVQLFPEVPAAPAHAALANAIFLLGCHFSSVHSQGTGKTPDLSAHEQIFLTRSLRGIAAALEEGEAAASSSDYSPVSSRSPVRFPSRSRASESPKSIGSPDTPFSSPVFEHTHKRVLDVATPLLDAVQASALLAVYFFAKARLLEGYYHASAAARLAVSLGMHQIRSPVWRPSRSSPGSDTSSTSSHIFGLDSAFPYVTTLRAGASDAQGNSSVQSSHRNSKDSSWTNSSNSPTVILPPAKSAREHQERVSAFWSVFIIDRCWSVATGLPSSLPDDDHPQLKISTVWPWDTNEMVTRANADYSSLSSLFDTTSVFNIGPAMGTTKALKSKAAALFERAARLASMQADPTHWEQLTQLEFTIASFCASLPDYCIPSNNVPGSSDIDVELAIVHTLSQAAIIQLYHPQAQRDVNAHATTVRAAATALNIVRRFSSITEYALLDPVIGSCWMCVSDVLLRERMWGGDMAAAKEVAVGIGAPCFGVEAELDTVIAALRQLSFVFPIAQYQVQRVEQSRNGTF